MKIKLSESAWRAVGEKTGWLKSAGMRTSFTADQFLAQSSEEKKDTAMNTTMVEAAQLLFFTEDYKNKGEVLQHLVHNPVLTPGIEKRFFTEDYESKSRCLKALAQNPEISVLTKALFFTERYEGKASILKLLDKAR